MKYEVLIFDLDETLFDFKKGEINIERIELIMENNKQDLMKLIQSKLTLVQKNGII